MTPLDGAVQAIAHACRIDPSGIFVERYYEDDYDALVVVPTGTSWSIGLVHSPGRHCVQLVDLFVKDMPVVDIGNHDTLEAAVKAVERLYSALKS